MANFMRNRLQAYRTLYNQPFSQKFTFSKSTVFLNLHGIGTFLTEILFPLNFARNSYFLIFKIVITDQKLCQKLVATT